MDSRSFEETFGETPLFPFSSSDWSKAEEPYPFFLRAGELTVLAGTQRSGHSYLMTQLAVYLALLGINVAIASFSGNGLSSNMTTQIIGHKFDPEKDNESVLIQANEKLNRVKMLQTAFFDLEHVKYFIKLSLRA